MANTTVYPYGTDGELPSSIGIINDLVTGGADKALSAEQGVVIKSELDNLSIGVFGGDEVTMAVDGLTAEVLVGDEHTYTASGEVIGHISNTGYWIKNNDDTLDSNASIYIDLSQYKSNGYDKIKIQAKQDRPTRYTFFKSNVNDSAHGTDLSNKLSAYMGSDYYKTISIGEQEVIEIPSDANYIYFIKYLTSSNVVYTYAPKSVTVFITENVPSIDERFSEYNLLYDKLPVTGYLVLGEASGNNHAGKVVTDPNNEFGACRFVDVSELVGQKIRFVGCEFNTNKNVGYAFYTTASSASSANIVQAYKYSYDSNLLGSRNVLIEVVVPSDAIYFRSTYHDYGNLQGGFYIEKYSRLTNLIVKVAGEDDGENYIGITHLKPENKGQLNAIRRMRKFTDILWTPAFEIDRGSTAGGKSFFHDKFLAGKTYKGLPYARADQSKYGYSANQFKIGFYISIETFMTAAYNRGTVLEIESAWDKSTHRAAFYANICAGGVSAALHHSYLRTNDYDGGTNANPPSGFTDVGRISSTFDLLLLKLGDVMAKYDVHTVMVTDVIIENGVVEYVEVSENTTQGNGNYTIVGGEFGGVARRLWWSVDEFLRVWDGYRVLRYSTISSVPYIPSPYAPMPNEQYGYARYTMAVLPYMGNGFRYMLVNGVVPSDCRKLVVEEPDVYNGVVLWNKKVDGEWVEQTPLQIDYTDYDASNHPYVYVGLPSDMGVGEYEAYIQTNDSGVVRDSTKCYWQVVSSLTMLEDY